jgi:hypothetical protein
MNFDALEQQAERRERERSRLQQTRNPGIYKLHFRIVLRKILLR